MTLMPMKLVEGQCRTTMRLKGWSVRRPATVQPRGNSGQTTKYVLSYLSVSISKIPQDLVVIKHSKESKPSKRKRASNQTSLPSECHTGDVWTKQVIPTLIYWLGCQASPWYPAPDLILETLRTTIQQIYIPVIVKKIHLEIKKNETYIIVSDFF